PQRRVQRPCPQPGLVHDAKPVREPGMLRRREHPSGALELADAPEALDPRGVEEVVLGHVLGLEPCCARLVRRKSLAELHVPVDRVADEVHRRERQAPARYGTQTFASLLHEPRLPRWSAAW